MVGMKYSAMQNDDDNKAGKRANIRCHASLRAGSGGIISQPGGLLMYKLSGAHVSRTLRDMGSRRCLWRPRKANLITPELFLDSASRTCDPISIRISSLTTE